MKWTSVYTQLEELFATTNGGYTGKIHYFIILSKEGILMDEQEENNTPNAKKIDRNELLKKSSWLVDKLHGRLSKARFIVQESDPIKLQYYRVLIQAVQAHNAILKDEELEEINARMELIEAAMEVRK
jgi:hypothetical protein